jgi:hypothetical protein
LAEEHVALWLISDLGAITQQRAFRIFSFFSVGISYCHHWEVVSAGYLRRVTPFDQVFCFSCLRILLTG